MLVTYRRQLLDHTHSSVSLHFTVSGTSSGSSTSAFFANRLGKVSTTCCKRRRSSATFFWQICLHSKKYLRCSLSVNRSGEEHTTFRKIQTRMFPLPSWTQLTGLMRCLGEYTINTRLWGRTRRKPSNNADAHAAGYAAE